MVKTVVTGGCGFIGSHLVEALCQQGHDVVVIDNLTTGHLGHIEHLIRDKKVKFVEGDIHDDALLEKNLAGAQRVFHLAARISVPESFQEPLAYLETNTADTLKLLNICHALGVKHFVFASSAAIYGDNATNPKHENIPPEPQSPYAITKLDGELYCSMYSNKYNVNASALRYFNVYGPRQNPRSAYASVIPLFIDNALQNKPLIIFGDGEQTRDFIFVKDIVNANLLAAEQPGNIFNVASGQRVSINTLAKMIIQITQSKSTIEYQPARAGDIVHSQGDIKKITQALGFKPQTSLMDGLMATVASF
jgi:UDP-glucose 4-epimerase